MTTPSLPDAAQLQALQTQQLLQARAAYHRVVTGGATLEARHADGRMVRWDHTNLDALRRYINSLETSLGLPPTAWTGTARTRARRVMF